MIESNRTYLATGCYSLLTVASGVSFPLRLALALALPAWGWQGLWAKCGQCGLRCFLTGGA